MRDQSRVPPQRPSRRGQSLPLPDARALPPPPMRSGGGDTGGGAYRGSRQRPAARAARWWRPARFAAHSPRTTALRKEGPGGGRGCGADPGQGGGCGTAWGAGGRVARDTGVHGAAGLHQRTAPNRFGNLLQPPVQPPLRPLPFQCTAGGGSPDEGRRSEGVHGAPGRPPPSTTATPQRATGWHTLNGT